MGVGLYRPTTAVARSIAADASVGEGVAGTNRSMTVSTGGRKSVTVAGMVGLPL